MIIYHAYRSIQLSLTERRIRKSDLRSRKSEWMVELYFWSFSEEHFSTSIENILLYYFITLSISSLNIFGVIFEVNWTFFIFLIFGHPSVKLVLQHLNIVNFKVLFYLLPPSEKYFSTLIGEILYITVDIP